MKPKLKMKLIGHAALEAKRESSGVVLMAKFGGKTYGNISEKNAQAVIERGGEVWADVVVPAGTTVEAYRTPMTHDEIVIKRAQRRAEKGKR